MANESKTQKCVAKLGEPYNMYECGEPCYYHTAEFGEGYSGWYHVDPTVFMTTGHHAVPKSMVY